MSRRRRSKVRLLNRAYLADAAKCHQKVVTTWRTLKTASSLGESLDIIRRTEYWRELGARHFRAYLENTFGLYADEAFGYAEMYRLREVWPLVEGVEKGRILPQALALVGPLVTPASAGIWLPLAQHLTLVELRSALKSYNRNKTGIGGDAKFIPLWVPQIWYEQYWKPLEQDETRPFLTMVALMETKNAKV